MTITTIRPEQPGDARTIYQLTEAAFRNMPYSDGDEHELVDRLREHGDLTLSLVAERTGQIVGHIAFSPVEIGDGTAGWFGLGPVSVWPDLHGQGIGSALVRQGIEDMRRQGAQGVVLLGSPQYYSRFGFAHDPRLAYPGPSSEYFQCLPLAGRVPQGVVRYCPAFGEK